MKRQIGILVVCLFPFCASAQTYETFKEAVQQGIDSLIRARSLAPGEVSVLADTMVRISVSERKVTDPKAIVFVQYFERRMGYDDNQMMVKGSILYTDARSPEAFSFIAPPYKPEMVIVTTPKPKEPESFWDSFLQPALVTLGAVAIIALFFLVRS